MLSTSYAAIARFCALRAARMSAASLWASAVAAQAMRRAVERRSPMRQSWDMMNPTARYSVTATALLLVACSSLGSRSSTPKVGPPNGTVFVVGGGAMSRSEWQKFIELAGGPDALIIDVPTAGGAKTDAARRRG